MKTFNQVILIGHLGRDAETKFTAAGDARTTFSMATNRRVKVGDGWAEEPEWANCVLWRQEGVASYLTKGTPVMVQGRLQTRKWDKDGETRYSTEVVVAELLLLGGGSESPKPAPLVSAPRSATPLEITDDDVPF